MANSITRRELIRKFRKLGFSGPASGGRHQFMILGALKVRIQIRTGVAALMVRWCVRSCAKQELPFVSGKEPDRVWRGVRILVMG